VQSTKKRRDAADQADHIDGFLLRIFVAVMEERSVSRAAMRLNIPQPTVSAALNRLRKAVGDPLVTRGRHAMVPTERADAMLIQARALLDEMGALCRGPLGDRANVPRRPFAIGTFDYIGPDFVPIVVNEVLRASPLTTVQVHQLSVSYDYMDALESGPLDLVIGNWAEPVPQLRHLNLFADETVCVVRKGHPLIRSGFDRTGYLDADHVGLIPYHVDRLGVIDEHLAKLGLKRNIRVVLPTFNGVANLVAHTDLVFTTCRSFIAGHARGLSLRVVRAPIAFPAITFRLLWHERSHRASEHQQMRANIAAALKRHFPKSRIGPRVGVASGRKGPGAAH
jgi:DNA-binding transcriptional LysR family regulator